MPFRRYCHVAAAAASTKEISLCYVDYAYVQYQVSCAQII